MQFSLEFDQIVNQEHYFYEFLSTLTQNGSIGKEPLLSGYNTLFLTNP